jgi:hypothetical protein
VVHVVELVGVKLVPFIFLVGTIDLATGMTCQIWAFLISNSNFVWFNAIKRCCGTSRDQGGTLYMT